MRAFILVCLVACFLVAFTKADETLALSPLQRAKMDNHSLKVQLAQCQATVAQASVQAAQTFLLNERTELEADFRKALKPSDDATFNWVTGTFDEPAKKP